MSLRVFIAVTHLLGIGHLARAAAIGRALAGAGHRVLLASGGRVSPLARLEGLDHLQLPPVHCVGVDFRTLRAEDGARAAPALLAERRRLLVEAAQAFAPDAVLTELFPFGRRQLAGEYEALLRACQALRPRPAVLASIRDVLNPPAKPERAGETLDRLGRFYDLVLAHGDGALTPLALSWPLASALATRLIYTGYIADPAGRTAPSSVSDIGDILVSGGGSAASLPLYRAALAAAALAGDGRNWRILVGPGVDEPDFTRLVADAPGHVGVERARPDFRDLLARCAVSVSQAGYNTVVDLATARARAVLVPFEGGHEQEQAIRAEAFAARGLALVLREADLTPATLAEAVGQALSRPRPAAGVLDLRGAAATVAAVEQAVVARRTLDSAWDRLRAALAGLRKAGIPLRVWWRDDDAVAPSPALERLLALAGEFGAPLALAVIPAKAGADLAQRLRLEPGVEVLVHGWSHANHALPGAKKCEIGGSDPQARLAELAAGLARLRDLFGDQALPVLVPPWNRLGPGLAPKLPSLGFRGLSLFKPRPSAEAAPGLALVNTHLDPVDWRGGGGLADPVGLIDACVSQIEAMKAGRLDGDEPIGLLTHHLIHDPWTWSFITDMLQMLAENNARFLAASTAFRLNSRGQA